MWKYGIQLKNLTQELRTRRVKQSRCADEGNEITTSSRFAGLLAKTPKLYRGCSLLTAPCCLLPDMIEISG